MAPKPQEKVGENVGRLNKSGGEAVVISGISGQYPMSNNVKEFSDILYSKVNPITTENKRWKSNYPEVSQYVGTVPGLDRFDAQFFKVHYRLGSSMDTMSKKILEHTYQALYDAGINPHHLNGKKVAVFIGACFSETEKASFYASSARTGFGIMGCSKSMFANRISYWLNLKGPSMAIDEACCSSSAALTQAYQALTRGDCEAAIVGGANLILHPQTSIHTGRIIANCSDGKTKSFDDNADGCVKSEAIQVVFLQKAKDALRTYAEVVHIKNEYIQMNADHGFYRDPIVINKFLEKFYDEVRISPEVVEYVEAMGSAIPNADKAELEVISELFCKDRINPLLIGSVFSNIGYSEASSGLCSLIKVLLGYHTGKIPANLHCSSPRSDVPALHDGRMRVVTENEPFRRGYVAINNHSITGCTAHMLVAGRYKPKDNTRYKSSIPHIVTISARHESAVQKIFEDLKSRPVDPEQLALFHNIHNTNISGHLARGYIILDTNSEQKTVTLTENCEYFDDARRPLWFVYSGMGSQWAGMGTQLMRIPIFAAAIYRCQRALEPKGIDLVHIITSTDKKIFDNILHSFVGIAAVQIGLTDVLRELGLFPNKIIGHSVGELGCAYADGCFTAEEMILSAYSRGLVSIQTPFIRGSMAAVGIGYQDIKDMLPPEIEVACHNSSESSTISGPADMMREFVASLSSKGIFVKDVPCSNIAYHSRYIAEAGPKLLKYLSEVIKAPKQRSDRWLSTSVSRDKWDEPAAQTSSAVYHTNNLLNPVLFEETSRLIPSNAVLVEIAPHGLLQAILKRSLPVSCKHIPLTRRGHPDNALMVLESIGKLFMEGYHPKVNVLYPKIEFPVSTETPMMSHLVEWAHNEKWPLPLYVAAHRKIAAAAKYVVCLHDPEHNYLSGHVIKGKTVYPFAAALVAVWDTVAMYTNKPKKELSVTFRDIQFFAQPVFNKNRPLMIHVAIHRGQGRFEVMEGDSKIATGYVNEGSICDINNTFEKVADKSIMFNSNDVYNILFEREYSYGGVFRNIYGVDDTLTEAKLLWNSNWVSLIDGMLQMNVLRQKHDAVSKPLGIRKMCIDIEQHNLAETDNLNRKIFLTANVDEILDKTRCGGITMENIKFCNLSHSNSEEVILRTPHFNNSSGSDDGKYSVPLEYKPLASPYVSLRSKSIGDLNSLTWVETKEAAASGIPVMIHYAGLNTVDSMTATGRYGTRMESDIEKISYKMDFSGITECGVQVMGVVPSGAASNRVMASPELLWPVPKHWTMEDAATVPLPYALAFYCLAIKVQMLSNQSILVHGGAGALGQAVISIALAHGLQVFATVSDVRKKRFLMKIFPELKEDYIGNSRDATFKDMVKIHTKGLGVTYVINCVKADLRVASMSCVSPCGAFIDIIQTHSDEEYSLPMGNLVTGRCNIYVDFSTIFNEETDMLKLQYLISEGIREGYVRPLSRVVYAASDASRAFRLLRVSQHRGRVLLTLQHAPHAIPRFTCSQNMTHVVICDDQTVGIQLAHKLVKRGARKLLLKLSSLPGLVMYKKQSWQNAGVDAKLRTCELKGEKDVSCLLSDASNMGSVEGIYIVTTESISEMNGYILSYLDDISRKLCPSIKYFAVMSAYNDFGNEICIARVQKGLPATKLCLPSIKKVTTTEESLDDGITSWLACDALENALCSKEVIITTHVEKCNSSMLQRIATVADIQLSKNVTDHTTLQELGVSTENVQAVDVLLCEEFNMSLSEESILRLNVKDIQDIEQALKGRKPTISKGLEMFFSHFDSDELSSTTEFMLLPTLANDTMMRSDEFDITKTYLFIVPGLEGHYEKYRDVCERMKIPALVLQPALDAPDESIKQIAARYAQILTKKISVKDHFYLLGYESGVMVALETAAILEEYGLSGTVYLIGTSPDKFKSILKNEIKKYETDDELQIAVLKHMYKLMCGAELSLDIDETLEWNERIESCIRDLLPRVSLSAQYSRLNLMMPYHRIKQALQYEPQPPPLKSKIVLLLPNSSGNDAACEELQKYSKQPLVVHNLTLPLAQALQDLRCATYINQHLDDAVLEEYNTKNHCETYLLCADTFIRYNSQDIE